MALRIDFMEASMKAINYAYVTRSSFFLLLHAVLSLLFLGSASAQSGLPTRGKAVAISKQYPTRSHIALLITRNANNWVHTHTYRKVSGKFVALSSKYDKSLRVGDLVVVPLQLVRTHADTVQAESINSLCQQKYSDSTCAWRVAKINSIPLRDTVSIYAKRVVYVPNSFTLKTNKSAAHSATTSAPSQGLQNIAPARKFNISLPNKDYFIGLFPLIALGFVLTLVSRQQRKKRLSSLVTELNRNLRSTLPAGADIAWTLKIWSWSVQFIPPDEMTIHQFAAYKKALGIWVLSGPLRHLGITERYEPNPDSALQKITLTARKLADWSTGLSLAERQQIESTMQDFGQEFKKRFAQNSSNDAVGGPQSISFQVSCNPEQRLLEIRMRPAKNRMFPDYGLHKSVIEQDVAEVLRSLPHHGFDYLGCSPDSSWVLLRFNLETSTEGFHDERTELVPIA